MARSNGSSDKLPTQAHAITSLSVAGFKSIVDAQTIEIRPLTILAGANSSGKSSMMQPLLLLKQTLEAPYDPGPLLLNGPNVKFTAVSQFWPLQLGHTQLAHFVVNVGASNKEKFGVAFRWKKKRLEIEHNAYSLSGHEIIIASSSSVDEIGRDYLEFCRGVLADGRFRMVEYELTSFRPGIIRSGFVLETVLFLKDSPSGTDRGAFPSVLSLRASLFECSFSASWKPSTYQVCAATQSGLIP